MWHLILLLLAFAMPAMAFAPHHLRNLPTNAAALVKNVAASKKYNTARTAVRGPSMAALPMDQCSAVATVALQRSLSAARQNEQYELEKACIR